MTKESITGKTSKALVWIILLLVLLGLGGYGVTNFGGGVTSIGSVGNTDIDIRDYQRALTQELRALEAQEGRPVTLAEANATRGLSAQVQQRLITSAALDNETARLGISVSDETVRNDILDIPSFRGLDGKFDRETYRRALGQIGLKEAEYEAVVRRETARTLLQGAVLSGIKAPDILTKTFLDYAGERRNFTWIRLGQNNLSTPIPEPTDADLKAYYQSHTPDFTLPEMKRISYVWITPEMIQDQIPADEARLKEVYDSRINEFMVPEKRVVERLVFPTEEDARAAMSELESGETSFEDLVKKRGLSLNDISLGAVTRDQIGSEAADAVFALQAPGLAGLLPSSLGPAIFRVTSIQPADETTFEEARPQLLTEYQLDQARRKIDTLIPDIEDLLAGGATLEDIAKETDMRSGTIDWWDGLGDGIADYEAFRKAALAVNKGDFPEVESLEDGGAFAMQLEEILPPRLDDFENVKSKVIAGWENLQVETALQAMAEELAPLFANGADMSARGLTVTEEKDITRSDFIEGTPQTFLPTVFKMDKGEVKSVKGFGSVLLVRLDDILPPDPDNPIVPQLQQALDTQLRQSMAQDVFSAYVVALENEAGIQLNSAAINAVNAQFP